MSEIKKDLLKLEDNDGYISNGVSYVILEDHTIADIIRFAIEQSDNDFDAIRWIIKEEEEQ